MKETTKSFRFEPQPCALYKESLTHPDFSKGILKNLPFVDFEEKDFFQFLLPFGGKKIKEFIKNHCKHFYFEGMIDLRFLNKVNTSYSLEKGKHLYSTLRKPDIYKINNQIKTYNTKFNMNSFLENDLDQVIGNVKRVESFTHLFQFLEKVKWLEPFYQFISTRFLVTLLLSICSSPVLVRIQENISKFMALPLLYQDPRCLLGSHPMALLHQPPHVFHDDGVVFHVEP